ncbi:MAG: DUF1223 domain-containing protein [Planctomycetota bacterium]
MRSLLAAAALLLSPIAAAAELPTQTRPVTLVELFTSQGCHSCPPADAVLARLELDARNTDQPLAFLAFHVDYWNRLGWTDPFSDPAYSNRQRAYAQAFRSRTVYTPQMIVAGDREFVGSNANAARQAIDAAPDPNSSRATIALRRLSLDGNTITIDADLSHIPRNAYLFAALADGPHATPVPRGENAGKTLRESAVVRSLNLTDARPTTTLTLDLPPGIDADTARVVVWLQNPETMRIHHAVATTQRLAPDSG